MKLGRKLATGIVTDTAVDGSSQQPDEVAERRVEQAPLELREELAQPVTSS